MHIRTAEERDSPAIREIFNYEVYNSADVLELETRSARRQKEWMEEHSGIYTVIVALDGDGGGGGEEDGEAGGGGDDVTGFACLSPYRSRSGYRTTAETSVYVHHSHRKKGIGRALMEALLTRARQSGFHTLIARISGNNETSMNLHKLCGYELIGVEKQVGRKFGSWIDCSVFQKIL